MPVRSVFMVLLSPYATDVRSLHVRSSRHRPDRDRRPHRRGRRSAPRPKPRPAAPRKLSQQLPPELGGPKGPEPTRYGDWERKGIDVRLLSRRAKASLPLIFFQIARAHIRRPGFDMGGEILAPARHKAPASLPHSPAHCPPGRWRSDRRRRAAARCCGLGLAAGLFHQLAQGHRGAARLGRQPVPVPGQQGHFPRHHPQLGAAGAGAVLGDRAESGDRYRPPGRFPGRRSGRRRSRTAGGIDLGQAAGGHMVKAGKGGIAHIR